MLNIWDHFHVPTCSDASLPFLSLESEIGYTYGFLIVTCGQQILASMLLNIPNTKLYMFVLVLVT